jgi:hypothetical protein
MPKVRVRGLFCANTTLLYGDRDALCARYDWREQHRHNENKNIHKCIYLFLPATGRARIVHFYDGEGDNFISANLIARTNGLAGQVF